MFVLQKSVPLHGVDALTADLGFAGQIALDDATGDRYAKIGAAWVKVADGAGNPVAPPLSGQITLKNSSGTVSRTLTATNGVATLAATDALVTNGDSLTLQTSDGTTSAGNAGLNSPATATVASGVVTAVKAAS
ncbi:hypothetical protein L0Z16_22540 [Burkholderia multivorans]|uniref:hypothetical protein n=1 Tax=Burkholderia multivorans TaxID=87883 RepID=UPI000CFE3E22|nr:hypothetical protein [Burkholderia multivorans]MCL4661988.1 hypothetical protein [Burkholderia multivorans]MCO1353421.1 hypothetical protein [Burkholderia multivorans]MCO1412735.1 hypothetical protein [Burkholderia multivorans]MCO1447074.1 hypothetical protein [Burkholderia multivorans]PRE30138.1 hypothetical protein C6P79_07065 [Burkholderia multivorans]